MTMAQQSSSGTEFSLKKYSIALNATAIKYSRTKEKKKVVSATMHCQHRQKEKEYEIVAHRENTYDQSLASSAR